MYYGQMMERRHISFLLNFNQVNAYSDDVKSTGIIQSKSNGLVVRAHVHPLRKLIPYGSKGLGPFLTI